MNKVFLSIDNKPQPIKGITDLYLKDNKYMPYIVAGLIGLSIYLIIRNDQLKKSFGVTNGQAATVATMGL